MEQQWLEGPKGRMGERRRLGPKAGVPNTRQGTVVCTRETTLEVAFRLALTFAERALAAPQISFQKFAPEVPAEIRTRFGKVVMQSRAIFHSY
mmetsp:Transcript_2070/g.6044  ORF Transcript_2070/g.6044 Transcript_2070/m.6044 type:complete len:93 (+) Transcript_2070:1225-1503(+)